MFKNFFKIKKRTEVKPIKKVTTTELLKQQSFIGSLELFSPTWNFMNSHLHKQLNDLRKKNDNIITSFEKTQVIRGQIKEIKLLLAILHEQTISKYIEPKV